MRLRVLLSGLTFFAAALLLGWGPLVAQAHTVDPWKPCTIRGTAGADALNGTTGNDVICGFGGADTISGGSGNDIIRAGPGNDLVEGGAGSDVLMGGKGADHIWAYDGTHDHLNGGLGVDTAYRDRLLDRVRAVENMATR